MRRVRRAPSFTMRIAFALIALVSLLLVSVSADEKHGDGAVVHLEQETWDAVVAHGVFVVFFGATWCPHCVKLTPTWGELTTRVQDLRSRGAHGAHVAKVECTENEDLCGRMELQGYPSILTFVDGKRVDDYEGDRTLGELERYVRAQADKFLGAAAAGAEPAAPSPAAAPQAAPAVERKDAKGGKSNVHDDIRRTCNNMYKKDAPVSTAGTAVQLTAATFDEFVRSGSSAFVKFYAPWCTHCQRLQPVWEGLSSTLKDRVHVGKVDCTKETSLCQRFGIRAYPALKFFQKEDVIDYKGPRTMNALVAFCESQLEIPVVPLVAADLDKASKSHDLHFVLAYTDYEKTSELMADFIRVSKRFRGKAVFHVSSDPDILHTLDPGGAPVEELPRIYVVRGGEPKNTPRFCGEMDFESLLRWVTEKHEATLQELNESNAQTLLNGENGKLVLLGLLEPQTNLGKELIADLSRAAHEIAKQTDKTPRVVVAFLDIAKYPDHARRLYNHSPGAGPKIVVADPSNDRYFEDHLDGTFIGLEAAELVAAAEAARTGKLLVRYTDGVFVRTVKRISRSMHNLGSMVSSKPAFVVLVLFAVIASAVALLLFADSSGAGQKSGGKAE